MKLYVGIDLHSNNSYVVVRGEEKAIFQKRLNNDAQIILNALSPYKQQIEGVVVESTYNWYWLVDRLQAEGYVVHLANTTAIQQYDGLKYKDDRSDADWLAHLLQLGILPTGHIYPKERRGIRELLRKRAHLVQQKTCCLLSLQSMLTRHLGVRLSDQNIKKLSEDDISKYFSDPEISYAAQCQLKLLNEFLTQIHLIEKRLFKIIKKENGFKSLKSAPGIGDILASVILLETGDIGRFKSPGNYASYCRCVDSKSLSNGKKKGENNRKSGNKYLAWAYMEAANYAIRYYPEVQKYYQKKMSKTHRVVALKTVASKLCRACYHILKSEGRFEMQKAFA